MKPWDARKRTNTIRINCKTFYGKDVLRIFKTSKKWQLLSLASLVGFQPLAHGYFLTTRCDRLITHLNEIFCVILPYLLLVPKYFIKYHTYRLSDRFTIFHLTQTTSLSNTPLFTTPPGTPALKPCYIKSRPCMDLQSTSTPTYNPSSSTPMSQLIQSP